MSLVSPLMIHPAISTALAASVGLERRAEFQVEMIVFELLFRADVIVSQQAVSHFPLIPGVSRGSIKKDNRAFVWLFADGVASTLYL